MPGPLPPAPAAARPVGGGRVAAWVAYDLANTVYAATLTFLFTPWARQQLGGLSWHGVANFASMALAALLVPLLGALADHTARTRRYLVVATVACVLAVAGWGLDLGNGALLACFFVANLTYNLALLFYNALLPSVADGASTGRVSGLGVGVGYFGTILVLATLLPLPAPVPTKFLLAAALFLVAALPCLCLVDDRRVRQPGSAAASLRAASARLRTALRELPRRPMLLWFLLGNFCLVDVLNTAILYFAAFTAGVFERSAADGTLQLLGHRFGSGDLDGLVMVMGLSLNGLALPFGIVAGRWTDRHPLAVLRASGAALAVALAGGAWFGGTSALGYLLTLGVFGAFGLAGVWTAGRQIVLVLAPPDRIGEFFGLYGITLKLSVVGSVVYGLVSDAFGDKPAMLAQGVQLLLGLGCLAMVRLPRGPAAASPP